jgi:alanine-glyoxylate transaminase/serine-glyoxylate transaminase/serine-pyruvate transaminase
MTSNTRIPGRGFLHSPGPTHLPDEVLDAMHRQPMDLVDPRLAATISACEAGLQRLPARRWARSSCTPPTATAPGRW